MPFPPSISFKKKRKPLKQSLKPSKALTALLLLTSVQAMEFTAETDKDTVSKAFQKVDIKPFQPENIIHTKYKYEVEGEEPQEKLKNQKNTVIVIDFEAMIELENKRNKNIQPFLKEMISQRPSLEDTKSPSKESLKENPFSQSHDPKKSEERKLVKNAQEFPSSTNVFLTMTFGESKFPNNVASGVMIGPRHVLTAGHNVYEHQEKEWASSVTAYPGTNEKKAPFGSSSVVKAFIPQEYHEGNNQHDIAVLILKNDLGIYTGWAGIQAASDDVYNDMMFITMKI